MDQQQGKSKEMDQQQGKSKEMDQQQPGESKKMEVEKKLVKYASLSVRKAKILVESKANSSPPREGQEMVVMNSEADWQSLFEEAEKLRQEDRADGLEVQKTLRLRILMAGIVSTVAILGGVAIVPLVVYNVATATLLHTAWFGFGVGGLVSVTAIASELTATFKRDASGTTAELKTLEKEFGN